MTQVFQLSENILFANQVSIGYELHMYILEHNFILENIELNFSYVF